MQAVHDIFGIWGSLADFARDVNRPYATVCKWNQRERIPTEAWDDVIAAAQKRGRKIDHATLRRINPPRASAQGRAA
jgi:hypothetical protein